MALANPLSAELGVMRTSLLPGLVAALGRNAARQQRRLRLFEVGKTFHARAAGEAPQETRRIAAVACGDVQAEQWGVPARPVDFHDIKGDLEALAAASGARLIFRPSQVASGHPGRSADILRVDGDAEVVIGWIGQLHPRLQKALDLDAPVVAFEVELAPLQRRALPAAAGLSPYPSVRRDLAFVVPETVSWAALETSVRAAAGRRCGT